MKILIIDDEKIIEYINTMIKMKFYYNELDKEERDKIFLLDKENENMHITIATSYEKGLGYLKSDTYNMLFIDHDLGEEKTGYDIMNWMQQHYPEVSIPRIIYLISHNPVGKVKMFQVAEIFKKMKIIDEVIVL